MDGDKRVLPTRGRVRVFVCTRTRRLSYHFFLLVHIIFYQPLARNRFADKIDKKYTTVVKISLYEITSTKCIDNVAL